MSWVHRAGFVYVEMTDVDLKNLTKESVEEKFGIDL